MAIDTREKRASVVGIVNPLPPSPTPNASKDEQWRQEVGHGYPGIAPVEPTPGLDAFGFWLILKRRRRD